MFLEECTVVPEQSHFKRWWWIRHQLCNHSWSMWIKILLIYCQNLGLKTGMEAAEWLPVLAFSFVRNCYRKYVDRSKSNIKVPKYYKCLKSNWGLLLEEWSAWKNYIPNSPLWFFSRWKLVTNLQFYSLKHLTSDKEKDNLALACFSHLVLLSLAISFISNDPSQRIPDLIHKLARLSFRRDFSLFGRHLKNIQSARATAARYAALSRQP